MLSNNTIHKYRTNKGPRDVLNDDYNPADDQNYDNSSLDGETDHRYHQRYYRGGQSRSTTEFRSSRNPTDRRWGYNRGRGVVRKYDRHETTGKFYEPEKKSDINLPEDTRISKLLRRLSIETDQENSLLISKKLLQVLLLPDNAIYVRKAFHILSESMYEILQVSPGQLAKQQAARALGRMGYIMGQENDFERYQNWLFQKISQSFDDLQILLMKSLKETLEFEKTSKQVLMAENIENLLNNLVSSIEITENPELFKTNLDILLCLIEIYPDCIYGQFRDLIDLLFGWHVDHTQSLSLIEFISGNLQRLSQHFKFHIDFVVQLIDNFLEDITNVSVKLDEDDNTEHVTVLILALNTILKCLDKKLVKVELIKNCLTQILQTTNNCLNSSNKPDNLLIAANQSISLLLSNLDSKPQNLTQQIYDLINLQLEHLPSFTNETIISILLFITKIIKELSTNLPIELLTKLLGPQSNLIKLRLNPVKAVQNSLICVYQALLNVKNVSLLQEAYRLVLCDLELVYTNLIPIKKFVNNNEFHNCKQFELSVLFLLRCLSQLANASSIIVMWALKPSILELGLILEPFHKNFDCYPHLQFSLLYFLYSHCKCYNHFISSSNLVKQQFTDLIATKSPNLGNFEIILDILCNTLKQTRNCEVLLLLLQWLNDILINSDYLISLYNNEKFVKLTEILIKVGYDFNTEIIKAVCLNLLKLLENKQLKWSKEFYKNCCDLCKLHLNSNYEEIREIYAKLLSNLPWDIFLVQFNQQKISKNTNINNYNNYIVKMAQLYHLNTCTSSMYPLQFKQFMNYLLKNEKLDLQHLFLSCFNSQLNFYDVTRNCRSVLNNWATLDLAQFCVNYKLRTPLGKPNETFTTIESGLNSIGNELLKGTQICRRRVLLLLCFIEILEKTIYNAAEGCALAMPQPIKPVRSFFIANANTCNEWIGRIRLVVIDIALNLGEPTIALRHTQLLLAEPIERIVLFHTKALLNLNESEALYGLYVFLNKKYVWIKLAAEQASKKYEIAIEGYKKVLDNDSSSDLKQFLIEQVIFCYKELKNLNDLIDWYGKELLLNHKITINLDCFNNLYNYEEGLETINDLQSWNYNEQEILNQYENLNRLETNLFALVLTELPGKVEKIKENLKQIENNLQVSNNDLLKKYLLLQYICNGLKQIENNEQVNVFLVTELFNLKQIDSFLLKKILWWIERFEQKTNQSFDILCNDLRLEVVQKARKSKNFKLALTELKKSLKNTKLLIDSTNLACSVQECLTNIQWTVDLAKIVKEVIKLSYNYETNRQNTFNLCVIASTSLTKCDNDLKEISSKILLKLANWLEINDVSIMDMNSDLGKFLMVLPEFSENNPVIPLNDMAIGKLLKFSVHQSCDLAKSWLNFGNWCFKWGKKIVDYSIKDNQLTDNDQLMIKRLLPDVTDCALTRIFDILKQTNNNEDDIEDLNKDTIKYQLKSIDLNDLQINDLIKIWKNSQKRIYNYYSLTAEAYFKYLQLTNNQHLKTNTKCNLITITLRLLRLIVKYALELQEILEIGLKTTPTQPWKIIIPQLFSHLNHQEDYVRLSVSDLLCRIAENSPDLIIFPAVVGALDDGLKFDFSEITLPKDCLSQVTDLDNYDSEDDCNDNTNILQSCFKTMVDTLSKQDLETITQVEMLVKELRRITILWDELWLNTLLQNQNEINKRQQQLEYEINKVNLNNNLSKNDKLFLIKNKYQIIIKPLIFILEQLKQVTSLEAETPHEKQFQEKYMTDIVNVITKLKDPENVEKVDECLQPLKLLFKLFQQKFHKRSSYTLKLNEISPILAKMKNTLIAMPGLKKTTITISQLSNCVTILPTKTKPKKLIFHGSNGKNYTYLFKGLEDLHLDERIMQFLNIANIMMSSFDGNLYKAKHYSVIPLGPRSGLISWVDNTTPLFTLYKRWQQRELSKANIKNSISCTTTTVLRPSELFYNKLNPLLKENGVKNLENRKEWPLNVLKQVLNELIVETPNDLLAKELWCYSVNSNLWWHSIKKYSYSLAVMSIIGYIIGLGDRHLDNVLIDLISGEVVHIDYNVCFEKGKTLRVPEKVPFRLTPNLKEALGVTGVEGIFRLACENVLKTMRKNRETILTLLEAFVYDPLIDWTIGSEVLAGTTFGLTSTTNLKQNKKDLEKDVTVSMFNVRCMEMKTEWNDNKIELLKEIPLLKDNLNLWLAINDKIKEAEDYLQDLHQQMALVKEAEAHGINKHSLYDLPMRYENYCKTKEIMNTAKKELDKITEDTSQHILLYNEALKLFSQDNLIKILTNLNLKNNLNIFELVKEFLQNAGKNDLIQQFEQSEIDLDIYYSNEMASIKNCLQLLQEYNAILMQCPKNYKEKHRMYLFLQWTEFILNEKSTNSCDVIYEKFRSFLDLSNSQNTLQFTLNLETIYKELMQQINKFYEDLTHINQIELEKLYNNAKLNVKSFLNCEKNATNSLKFVIANELILLNKNFLAQEITANRSGVLLIKLQTKDGDWFLDDLILNSNRTCELINNLPITTDNCEDLVKILNGITITNNLYNGLNELLFNFHTIILPETIKKMQCEDFSVLKMMADLNLLIDNLGDSIPDIIGQLEKILPCLFMQMDINPSFEMILDRVSTLRTNYQSIINNNNNNNEILSAGQMLLMGFNGLFEKLDQEMNNLIQTLNTINIPQAWKKLDQIKEAKSISAHIIFDNNNNDKVGKILQDIFLLKRIQTIVDFFGMAQEICESFNLNKCIIYNDEQLQKPIRQFIADFISRQLLGIMTEIIAYSVCFILRDLDFNVTHEIEQKDFGAESKIPLDELCHKAWNYLLKQNCFTQNLVSQASSLESNLKSAWEKLQEPKKLQLKLQILQSSAVRVQNQLTVFNFMYEEILSQLHVYTQIRSKFLIDLKQEMTNLESGYVKLCELREKQQIFIENSLQRLNWAKGANPNLIEISTTFKDSIKKRNDIFSFQSNLINDLLKSCKVILQHELLRSHCLESKNFDKLFLNSFEKWRLACQYLHNKNDLSITEENIMNLLNKELLKKPDWLNDISDLITNLINSTQVKLQEEKTNLFSIYDAIISSIDKTLKPFYNTHLKLMNDVKSLIKTLTKFDDYQQKTQQFIQNYRIFNEKFQLLLSKFKKETTIEDVNETLNYLNFIEENVNDIYEDLLNLVNENCKILQRENCKIVKQDNSIIIQSRGQQRNAYAVNVWRRVKMKLEGRDPEPGRKLTPQEQVDYVIREALNLDNMALMYEGWTPWV